MRLKDEVALITGAGSGMGRAGAVRFAQEGAAVVAVDLNEAAAAETAAEIVRNGGRAIAVAADISGLEGNLKAVRAAVDEFGKLSIAWANAGIASKIGPLHEADEEIFFRMEKVNVHGPWNLARAAADDLKAAKGSMLITASLSGMVARPGNVAYSATKAAANALARNLAIEFAPHVRVNSIAPVATETPMQEVFAPGEMKDAAQAAIVQGIPLQRMATVDDIANAALFLASREAAMITGLNLPVDGGAAL